MREIIVDNTILGTLVCSTRAYMRHVQHYTSPDSAAALQSGIAGHSVLERYFKRQDKPLRGLREYAKWLSVNEATGTQLDPRFAYDNVKAVLKAWMTAHPLEALPIIIEPKMVEVGFALVLDENKERRIIFTGHVDVMAEDSQGLAPWDNKFTGRITAAWVEKWRLESQFTGYMWAAAQHTGKRITHGYVNAIELAALPHSDRECPKHKMAYAECSLLHAQSQVFLVNRTPQMLERWRQDAIVIADRFGRLQDAGVKLNELPMEGAFFNACLFCEFKKFCANDRPLNAAPSMFVKDVWNPLERKKEVGK